MRFWDSSAIVPLCVRQPARERSLVLFEDDPEIVVWWGTRVECVSALARLEREAGDARSRAFRRTWKVLEELQDGWSEVLPSEEIRSGAERALRVHSLRTGDAFQLAAGLDWAPDPGASDLVTFDPSLARAARAEGFRVLGEDET